jgi:hypothetical protein
MSLLRFTPEAPVLEPIRAAIRDAISSNPLRLKGEAIALRMGVSTARLYGWGEHGQKDIPLWRLIQFVTITGALAPLAAVARMCSCVVMPIPGVAGNENESAAVAVLKEFSDLMQEHAADMADGKISSAELARIEREGNEAMRAVVRLIEAARAKAGVRL